MPAQTVEKVTARLGRAQKKLAAISDAAGAEQKRAARKSVKRAQRKRRRLAVAAARKAGAGKDAKGA